MTVGRVYKVVHLHEAGFRSQRRSDDQAKQDSQDKQALCGSFPTLSRRRLDTEYDCRVGFLLFCYE